MPAMGPAKVKSRNKRSGTTSANALIWRARSARFRRRLSGTSVGASALVKTLPSSLEPRGRLFRRPFVEALGQAIDVFEPEGHIDLHRVLHVIRRRRQVLQNDRLEEGGSVLVRGPVSNVLRQFGLVLSLAGEVQELIGGVLVRAAFQDDP